MITMPTKEEYPAYYERYISLVADGEIKGVLARQLENTASLLAHIPASKENYSYAPGKWTLREVAGHITDTERIMSYRLLRIARGDQTPLAGYDEEQYVKEALVHAHPLSDLLEDFRAVRVATLALLRSLPEKAWPRMGFANNNELSVRALAYIMAAHELHHVKMIKEKYLT